MDAVWTRVDAELSRLGRTWAHLAREIEASDQTVNNWRRRGIPANRYPEIAEALGWSVDDLINGSTLGGVRYPVRNVRTVWVVGHGHGGMPENVWGDGDEPAGATDQCTEVATTDPQAFVTRVTGDSMAPRYMPGEYALVEPNTEPEIEDDVLVRLESGQTMIKRLVSRRGDVVRLGSYNEPGVMTFRPEEITWMYYVAHPIPARRIKQRT